MLEICILHANRLGLALDQVNLEAILTFSLGKAGVAVETLERVAHLVHSAGGPMNISAALLALGMNVRPEGNESINIDSLQSFSGVEFERLVCDLLASMRFLTELTKVSGDGGIDIIARLNEPIIGGNYFFQCKRFAPGNLIGEPQLRDFYGAVMSQRQALKAVFVTTSDFTPHARNFADKVGIELVNGILLSQLLKAAH